TLPIEALLAAGLTPVDLNNAFINGPDTEADMGAAESAGFPRSMCAWIQGIYGTVKRLGIRRVVGVLQGDCSYTEGLMDVLEHEGYEVTGFRFPERPDEERMRNEITALAGNFGVSFDAVQEKYEELRPLREKLRAADEFAAEGRMTNREIFELLINASDFRGRPAEYMDKVSLALARAEERPPAPCVLKLAMAGIPAAFTDIYDFLESRGVRIVYNEMPAEFAMLRPARDIVQQYTEYTYPYGFRHRMERIRQEVRRRGAAGVVHYVQTFCYRGMHDRLLREGVGVPVVTLEGDRPAPVSRREETRLEAFIEMLLEREQKPS
ncbi:MAG TPA: 2-hydroxyacyl-CoA dehydratase, partial [Planctomycetes bacterium]|nr:2-hydroxyacyl-CoA dehydratase [Planctomycetota bacterium]